MDIKYLNIFKVYKEIIYFYKYKSNPILIEYTSKIEINILISNINKWLLCNNKKNIYYCNKCENCIMFKERNNINYLDIDVKNNYNLNIDTIRNIIEFAYKKSLLNNIKIINVKNIELLSDQYINLLLKVIEEHNLNIYFLFSCLDFKKVKNTLISRCIKWILKNEFNIELSLNYLHTIFYKLNLIELESIYKLSNNSIFETINLINNNFNVKRKNFIYILYNSFLNKSFIKLLYIIEYHKYDNIILLLFINVILDAIKFKNNMNKIIMNLDELNIIKYISNIFCYKKLNIILNELLIFNFNINNNYNLNKYLFLMKNILFLENIINNKKCNL